MMSKIALVLIVCGGCAFWAHFFGNVPSLNWLFGAIAGAASMGIFMMGEA